MWTVSWHLNIPPALTATTWSYLLGAFPPQAGALNCPPPYQAEQRKEGRKQERRAGRKEGKKEGRKEGRKEREKEGREGGNQHVNFFLFFYFSLFFFPFFLLTKHTVGDQLFTTLLGVLSRISGL